MFILHHCNLISPSCFIFEFSCPIYFQEITSDPLYLNLISFHLNIVVLEICIISNLFPIQIQFQIEFLQKEAQKFMCFLVWVYVCLSVCLSAGRTGRENMNTSS